MAATATTARDLFDLVIRVLGEESGFTAGVSVNRVTVEDHVLALLAEKGISEDEAYLRRRIGFAHRNQREGYCGSRPALTVLMGENRPYGWGLTDAGVRKARELAGVCAWVGCGEPARVNSIYCSRGCSNNNARAQHAARLAAAKAAAAK